MVDHNHDLIKCSILASGGDQGQADCVQMAYQMVYQMVDKMLIQMLYQIHDLILDQMDVPTQCQKKIYLQGDVIRVNHIPIKVEHLIR